jgi:predicted Zn-dependent peptidase
MTNGNSGIFKGTSGDIIGKLQGELEQEKKTSQYWKEKYNEEIQRLGRQQALFSSMEHDHEGLIELLGKYENTVRELRSKAAAADSILAHRAHDIALAALKMEWKKGEINFRDGGESMAYYTASYKYVLEQLEADQNKE